MKFNCISGVVSTDERNRFDRMIFRTTRGNSLVKFTEINHPIIDPDTGLSTSKSVFLIFYKSKTIDIKLKKICDAFQAHRYTLPDMDDSISVTKLMYENKLELIDSRTVLLKNRDTRYKLCVTLAANVEKWTWVTLKEKAIYHTLNQCKADVSGMLRGEGWVISENMMDAINTVNNAHSNMDMAMPSLVSKLKQPWPTPPTHFITNKFTYGYQEFVNTYGIPRYREANPALFTAATFPFLFGVMYGDIGHGLFLLLNGINLCWNEKAIESAPGKKDEMSSGIFMGRYMILMMGFFAVYAGVIYNDCFSLGVDFFGTRYEFDGMDTLSTEVGDIGYLKSNFGTDESVYPFGLDPIWHVASNELLFFNSFKMKLSVVFGISQMFMGTCLKGINAIYFNEKLDLFFEVIPMMIFSSSLFLYMVLLIFMKWSINWQYRMSLATCYDPTGDEWLTDEWTMCDQSGNGMCTPWGYPCVDGDTTADKCPFDYGGSGDGCQPPNLITSLINIALSPGTVDEPMYKGQAQIQNILLCCAFASVPVLLLAKPYFLSQQVHEPYVAVASEDNDEEDEGEEGHGEEEEEHDFGEIVIHQAIETIEFVLGMVSNTASYLRLWALSLAHSELAGVFWGKCMLSTLSINWFATYLGFGLFAGVTFGVLLMMDVLECFLHALRLHWVEFQNKFFKADGIRFSPYSFKQIIIDSSSS
jgi:V-type H+-transporting ATPase subunit a